MKCSYHPEIEAVEVCINCNKPVCEDYKRQLSIRIYCESCANEHFTGNAEHLGPTICHDH